MDEEDGRREGAGGPLSRGPTRRDVLRAAPAAAAAAALGRLWFAPAFARDDDAQPLSSGSTREAAAVASALRWIAERESSSRSGMWGRDDDTRIADTALSLLALMAGGNTLGPGVPDKDGLVAGPTRRGRYADSVQRGVDFLARRAYTDRENTPAGYIDGDKVSKMHGHGYATLALATACANLGASHIDSIRASLEKVKSPTRLVFGDGVRWGLERAVRLIERTQDRDFGGWFYEPVEGGHEGSMTVTQITALRAAMQAGVRVSGKTMRDAHEYVRKSQNTTHKEHYGGFAYQVNTKERVSYALTAAALTTLFGLGRYGDQPGDREIIEKGLRYMDRTFDSEIFDVEQRWYYYRLFYAVQAIYLADDDARRRKYWPQIRDAVLENQRSDGSFSTRPDPDRSPEYCTAMGALILQVPQETLPIFQRR